MPKQCGVTFKWKKIAAIKTYGKLGFTLVELMVVIAIIALLAAAAMAAFTNVLPSARESRRLADIKNIVTALENYYSDQNYYPPLNNNNNYGWFYSYQGLDWITNNSGDSNNNSSPSFSGAGRYIDKSPHDPQYQGTWCTAYRYYRSGCCRYYLEYNMEKRDDRKAIGRYQDYNSTCRRYRYRVTGG